MTTPNPSVQSGVAVTAHPGAASDDGIISAAALHRLLGTADMLILDCRHDLAQPALGATQFREGHIPTAVFAHLDDDLSGPKAANRGRHPLPDPLALAARLRSWGMNKTSHVVAYDASEGAFAARAWWLLRWLGHARVAVLDGGWAAWRAANLPVSQDLPAVAIGDFHGGASLQSVADVAQIEAFASAAADAAASPRLLLDARAPDRFEGRNETVDPVAGHIPGAINRFWKDNLDGAGHFKPAERLRAEYEALLNGRAPQAVMLQCGSGVTACHNALAMHRAGLPGAALYAGSWSHWITDPARPVARGPAG